MSRDAFSGAHSQCKSQQPTSDPCTAISRFNRKALFEYRPSYVTSLYHSPIGKSERKPESYLTTPLLGSPAEEGASLFAPLLGKIVADVDFSRSYLNKGLDPISGMFHEKAHFGRSVIEDVVTDMALRYEMMNRAITTLENQICAVDSEVMQLPYFQLGFNKDLDRLKTTLEAKAMDFEQQKLEERVSGWKDITRLKTDLFEVLKDYVATQASSSFLNATGGEKHY